MRWVLVEILYLTEVILVTNNESKLFNYTHLIKDGIGEWNIEFRKVNLIKQIKLRLWLKSSFYNTRGKFY